MTTNHVTATLAQLATGLPTHNETCLLYDRPLRAGTPVDPVTLRSHRDAHPQESRARAKPCVVSRRPRPAYHHPHRVRMTTHYTHARPTAQAAKQPVSTDTRQHHGPVVLSHIANKIAPQLGGQKTRHRESPCRPPRTEQLDGRQHGTSILPLASGITTMTGPRVPTVNPDPSRIHDEHTATADTDRRTEAAEYTHAADADHGGRR